MKMRQPDRFRKLTSIALLSVFLFSESGFSVDLSPKHWDASQRARAEKLQMNPFPPKVRTVAGQGAIISDTGSPIAVHAGMEALQQGGTAADAAATVALTEIATSLGSYVSYDGVMQLVYFEARTGKVWTLNAGWNSYRNETDPKSIPGADLSLVGIARTSPEAGADAGAGRKTLVPGFMAGIDAMHHRFGRLPYAQLFAPAIWYSENGVAITPLLSAYFQLQGKFLARTAEGRQFMHQAGDDRPKVGDRFVQADLAKTLRGIAKHGAAYMYSGPWGKQFVATVQHEGGKATMDDMKAYRPVWGTPIQTSFEGDNVFTIGSPNEGGHQLLEALNLIEQVGLDRRPTYWNDPRAFIEFSRIMQLVEIGPYVTPEIAAFQHRSGLTFSPEDRITKAYAKAMAPMLNGFPGQAPTSTDTHHSAGVVVVDRWGNVAALVHTINTVPWGSTGIVVGGIPLSDAAGLQQARLAAIKPGDRLPDDMAPCILLSRGKPVLATASIGVSEIPETVRIVLGIRGYHLDAQSILTAPPVLFNFEPPDKDETYTWKKQLVPEAAYSDELLRAVQALGVKIRRESQSQVLILRGTTAVVEIDPATGTKRSAEVPSIIDFADSN